MVADFMGSAEASELLPSCWRGAGLAVEWLGNRLDKAIVMHEQPGGADQEVAVLGNGQVIDLLGRAGLDRLNCDDPVDHAQMIAGFQVARMVQPRPAVQKRWIPVATMVSRSILIRNVAAGPFACVARTGW